MKNTHWMVGIVVVAVLLVVATFSMRPGWPRAKELFEDATNVVFWDKKQTYTFLMEDKDMFVRGMGMIELQQRINVADADLAEARTGYKERSARTSVTFSPEEQGYLARAARAVDALLIEKGIAPERLNELPWIFALTEGNTYEYGVPHVRGSNRNVYMLSTDTLLQESGSMCQLSMTLMYLRMATLYPRKQQRPSATPLHAGATAFPKGWGLPLCRKM